jgi:predicted TIM-barrel fold metal-dependent hydrolase
MPVIDTHAHIIDPDRFPLPPGKGYKPQPEDIGTREAFCAVLDAHDVAHAVLVQLSGYGADNAAMRHALAAAPGRFKMVLGAVPDAKQREIADLAAHGAVGLRFNLVSYDRDGLTNAWGRRLLGLLKELGWLAQIYADDDQWPAIGPLLHASGVRVVIDHFGVRNPALGVAHPGFQALLDLGRAGSAVVKLSAPFRIASRRDGYAALDPFVQALLPAFGIDNCIWGSDWPFPDVTDRPRYDDTLSSLSRWLPRAEDRARVLWHNPARLFGFPGAA